MMAMLAEIYSTEEPAGLALQDAVGMIADREGGQPL